MVNAVSKITIVGLVIAARSESVDGILNAKMATLVMALGNARVNIATLQYSPIFVARKTCMTLQIQELLSMSRLGKRTESICGPRNNWCIKLKGGVYSTKKKRWEGNEFVDLVIF